MDALERLCLVRPLGRARSRVTRPVLHDRILRFRELGGRRGVVAAGRVAHRELRAHAARLRRRLRPPRVGRDELARALAGPLAEILEGPVVAALPTVARWRARLDGADAHDIVRRADAIVQHRFDLLGSGETLLGDSIDWHADFKSGRRWPLVHHSRIQLVYDDGSDVKVPWELSRCQHLPLLAAAARVSGETAYLDELGQQLCSWIAANPVELGVNWASTMDVAIRAANWTAALAVAGEAVATAPWLDDVLASLLLHGRFIRSHPGRTEVRGNHYLSHVAGLLVVASLFSRSAEGRGWIDWAVPELGRELEHQVLPDGCANEASTSYHRLVTELFVCGSQAAAALAPGQLGGTAEPIIERMLDFVADYTRPDEESPRIGDADDARFLPLDLYGVDASGHLHLFEQAGRSYEPARSHSAYVDGGFYVMRGRGMYVILHCGPTGGGGLGWHGHNDQLAFELAVDGRPLVVDPGSYVYTSDPEQYTRFRSTRFHATLEIDGAEQNDLRVSRMFLLPDRTQSECVRWQTDGDDATFVGRHHGYEALASPAVHTRSVQLDAAARRLVIEDEVTSAAAHELCWTFPLGGGAAQVIDGGVLAEIGGLALRFDAAGVEWSIEQGWRAPGYGRRVDVPFVRARSLSTPGAYVTSFVLRVC